jgi:putative cardiolipin synthase
VLAATVTNRLGRSNGRQGALLPAGSRRDSLVVSALIGPALLSALLVCACASLPPLDYRSTSHALEAPADSTLRAALDRVAAGYAGLSGIYPLKDGPHAFAARVELIDAAVSSIDVQYYIWHDDTTGRLMFDALQRAADRGVRVRLLLDDLTTSGLDGILAALSSHWNVEVRLFNPFKLRSFRSLGFVTDFSRLNRRMHNKSLTVDGVATILGGRNIADEYFPAGGSPGYVDLDVLAVGAVVTEVSQSFDEFWRSDSAYPVSLLIGPAKPADSERLAALGESVRSDPRAAPYTVALRDSHIVRDLVAGQLPLEWADTHLLADDPAKGLGKSAKGDELLAQFEQTLHHRVSDELLMVSPFFVPRAIGREMLTDLATRGVKVRVLTNGAESTDVDVACAAYRTYRKDLLKAGVELFEVKRQGGQERPAESSGADLSLHAKTFGIDRAQIFVGSFNFDPRSADLNTELGVVIDSPVLATALSQSFQDVIPRGAYQVELDPSGKLVWRDRRPDGREERLTQEPGAGFMRRTWLGFLSILPIEGQL